jgi:Protein of unknown function (DUF3662)/FHA domain
VNVLRSIENRIESLVEGVFGRAFRSHVQPVELARKLAKEMDDHKTISISRVYVPNEYVLYLSPRDREQFSDYEGSLLTELADYLSEHARREGYSLLSTPKVQLEEDADLDLGEFGIATRMVQPRRAREAEEADEAQMDAAPNPSPTKIFKPPAPAATAAVSAEEAEELGLARQPRALLKIGGKRHQIPPDGAVLGRSRDCEITIEDPNVSRRHAEVRLEDGAWSITDLGSTNGIEVNGERVGTARLEPGDRIVLGRTELVFEQT